MCQVAFIRPQLSAGLVSLCGKRYNDGISSLGDRFELPASGPRKAMRRGFRIVCLAAEPGETDRDSAANGFTLFEARVFADEDHLCTTGGSPGGELCAVEVNLRIGRSGSDLYFRQSTVPGYDLCDAGYRETLI